MRVRSRALLRGAPSGTEVLACSQARVQASVLALAAAVIVLGVAWPREARAQCVDDELKQELVGGRHYRGVEDRLFTKALRVELSAMGGYYAADLYSSNWLAGGALTFHVSEDFALEASYE